AYEVLVAIPWRCLDGWPGARDRPTSSAKPGVVRWYHAFRRNREGSLEVRSRRRRRDAVSVRPLVLRRRQAARIRRDDGLRLAALGSGAGADQGSAARPRAPRLRGQ